MSDRNPLGNLIGDDMRYDDVEYDLDHTSDGAYHGVVLTLQLGFAEFELTFEAERAEAFIVRFRDELVKAKQEQLEYDTNTDPDSGVAPTDGGVDE